MAFPGDSEVKKPPANAGDSSWIPGLGRSPGKWSGNPLQYSCLENSMDRGVWQGYSPWDLKRARHNLATKQQQQPTYIRLAVYYKLKGYLWIQGDQVSAQGCPLAVWVPMGHPQ